MISKKEIVLGVLSQLFAVSFFFAAVFAIDHRTITLIDSGTVLTTSDTLQADANMRDSVIGDWYGFRFLPQVVRPEWGINYLSEECSLGIDNDSGAPFLVIQTRWNPYYAPVDIVVDSMHNCRADSGKFFWNDMAAAGDTLWGYQIRAILKFEMDGDSASAGVGYDGLDTLMFNEVKIIYFQNVK